MESVTVLPASSTKELLFVFAVLLVATYLICRRFSVSNGGRKLPPTLTSLPIVGSLPFLPSKPVRFAEFGIAAKNKLGNFFMFYCGSTYVLTLSLNLYASKGRVTTTTEK